MKITSLVLSDVGPYRGPHEIRFKTGTSSTMTLIRARNGSGKTTIMDAVLLVLWGNLSNPSTRRGASYSDYLGSILHHGETLASIGIHFTHRGQSWKVLRSFRKRKGGTTIDEFSASVDGDSLSEDAFQMALEGILPRSFSSLLFFDGERLTELVSSSLSVYKDAISSFVKTDIVNQLKADLDFIANEKRKARIKTRTSDRQSEERALEALLEESRQKIKALRASIEASKEALSRAEDVLKKAERSSKNEERIRGLREEETRLERDIQELIESLKRTVSHPNMSIRLAFSLLQRGVTRLEKGKRDANEIQASVLIDERLVTLRATLLPFLKDETSYDAIRELLVPQTSPSKVVYDVESGELIDLHESLAKVQPRLKFLKDTRDELEEKRKKLKGLHQTQFEARSEEEIVPWPEALKIRDQELLTSLALESRLSDTEIESRKIQNKLDQLQALTEEERIQNEDQARIEQQTLRLSELAQVFSDRLFAARIEQFEERALSVFSSLHGKRGFLSRIEVRKENLDFILWTGLDQSLPVERCSAGERQILILSILKALIDISGLELPVFLDTPLGRLDEHHRVQLLRGFFPGLSSQVVLLATDSEVSASYEALCESSISKTYEVSYDSDKRSSFIQELS